MTSLVVERGRLPVEVMEWLEIEGLERGMVGLFLSLAEDGRLVLQRMEDFDPEMMGRVREASARYHTALERLAAGARGGVVRCV